MKRITALLILGLLGLSAFTAAQTPPEPALFARENLVAWCVVPFDKMKRGPQARAKMLKDLGFTKLAWDWRAEHLPQMTEEIKALHANNIELKAVWFWVNGGPDGALDDASEYILKTLEENKVKTELWLSFNDRYFENLDDAEKLKKAVSAIGKLQARANRIGCRIHLYNHGSWFGEPENQVRIIEALNARDIGIVYNFHHARHQVNNFPRLVRLMMPYLSTVNINGMKTDGPMILPVGTGDHELEMLQELKASGYKGAIGILSHVDDQDAAVVLGRNLDGLKKLLIAMGEKQALKSYRNQE